MQPRNLQTLAATAIALTVLAYLFLFNSGLDAIDVARWHKTALSAQPQDNVADEIEILRALKVPSKFTYRRYCVVATQRRNLGRERLVNLSERLPTEADARLITLSDDSLPRPDTESLLPPCQSTIELDVPRFGSHTNANTSVLMLGVATTIKRIEASLPAFSRWLSNTGSPLLVLLVDQPKLRTARDDLERIQSKYEASGIEIIFEPYRGSVVRDSEGLKNFALAQAFDKHRREATQWFGVLDDDTFFVSLPRVLDALSIFSHDQPWYLGALTEGHTRVSKEGFKAWGGAGFFISPPLMRTLAANSVECRKLDHHYGDLLWRDCILEVSSPTVPLTELPGLNQIDLWGDISGWYEAPHDTLLSLHHWKSWHAFPVPLAHEVSDVAGPDTFLQRYKFLNNTVFTNGFSIVEYPHGLPNLDLTELTFAEDVGINRPPGKLEFHHSLGQTRPALHRGVDKISWHFRFGVKAGNDTVRQFYVKTANSDRDVSVIEVDWRRA